MDGQGLILHIETATDICSVALSEGPELLALAESGPERSHATLLNKFIRQAMKEGGKKLQDLNAVAVSKGPGSYTGLRIGVSTAKGLAYGLDIPLLSCGTLVNLAHAGLASLEVRDVLEKAGDKVLVCPMLDARRMEVYSAFYTPDLKVIRDVSADVIDESSYGELLKEYSICFFGNGASKCSGIISGPQVYFVDGMQPSAQHMIRPVLEFYNREEFEDVAYFEPFYLKDFIATIPRKKVL